MKNFICYVDGGCNNIEHSHAYGSFIIFGDNSVIKSDTFILDSKTSNEAEYESLIKLLEYIIQSNIKGYWKIFSDSKLTIHQSVGKWKVNSENLKPLNKKVKELINSIGAKNLSIKWTPRKNIVNVLGH